MPTPSKEEIFARVKETLVVVSAVVQPAVVVLDQAEMKRMVEHVADSAGIP